MTATCQAPAEGSCQAEGGPSTLGKSSFASSSRRRRLRPSWSGGLPAHPCRKAVQEWSEVWCNTTAPRRAGKSVPRCQRSSRYPGGRPVSRRLDGHQISGRRIGPAPARPSGARSGREAITDAGLSDGDLVRWVDFSRCGVIGSSFVDAPGFSRGRKRTPAEQAKKQPFAGRADGCLTGCPQLVRSARPVSTKTEYWLGLPPGWRKVRSVEPV
jgi:hypothetical protein